MWGMSSQGDEDLERIRRKHRDHKPLEHPDLTPSSSGMFACETADGWVWGLRVKGLGVVLLKTSSSPLDAYPRVEGVSIFTEDEITGHA